MQIQGRLYQKDSAAFSDVSLSLTGDQYHLYDASELIESGLSADLEISSRLGNVERKITLANGCVFATHDNNEVDDYIKAHRGQKNLIHKLESKMQWVVVALIVTIASSFSFVRWGLPAITYAVADALPQSVNEVISAGTLEFLDQFIFDETQVTEQQQALITARFNELVQSVDSSDEDVNYRLYFRAWGSKEDDVEIPNALALPSGEIILTDKFVELTSNQDEIDSVLLHEIGHVYHRHSLKMAIHGTIVATLVTVIAGDASGFADMGIGVGSLLVTTHYSRKHESEADYFAFTNMLALNIDPSAFASIMGKMQNYMGEQRPQTSVAQNKEKELGEASEGSVLDYLDSHPKTQARIEQAERFSQCYQQGLIDCPNEVNKQ
jgi:Zn-dependent protease with chaperone function